MRILLTGSSGRIGRAIRGRLASAHDVVGLDRVPADGTDIVASVEDAAAVAAALDGVDAVVHAAALHAPHVGVEPDARFEAVNVAATAALARACRAAGVRHLVFTSTTALYGDASTPAGRAAWVTEDTVPQPRTVYHRTKLRAEAALAEVAAGGGPAVTVLRMSRCFPEPAPLMAAYRLHRGIDARDVADAHAQALARLPPAGGWRCLVVSGTTPFRPEDAEALWHDAPAVIRLRAPSLAAAFESRGWPLPRRIDRVYDASRARTALGWVPRFDHREVLAQADTGLPTVLPVMPPPDPGSTD